MLHSVDLALQPGEVHALIVENDAGKFASSTQAEACGIAMIHQEFNLATQLTVEQNIFLGREIRRGPFLNHAAMRRATLALLAQLRCKAAPDARAHDLSVPDRQMAEIAKALSREARVLIRKSTEGRRHERPANTGFGMAQRAWLACPRPGGGPYRAGADRRRDE